MPLIQAAPSAQTPAQQAASRIRAQMQMLWQQMGTVYLQGYAAFWNNPRATPTDMATAFGTDAAALFQLCALLAATINSAAAISGTANPIPAEMQALPAGVSVSFNADGSATITLPAPPAAP